MAFSFKKSAELFPAAVRRKRRGGFTSRRFDTAADAVRFAIEELPANSLNGAYLRWTKPALIRTASARSTRAAIFRCLAATTRTARRPPRRTRRDDLTERFRAKWVPVA